MASKSRYVYINKLDDRVNKYDNTYESAIKMKPVDVKSSTYYIKFTIYKIILYYIILNFTK